MYGSKVNFRDRPLRKNCLLILKRQDHLISQFDQGEDNLSWCDRVDGHGVQLTNVAEGVGIGRDSCMNFKSNCQVTSNISLCFAVTFLLDATVFCCWYVVTYIHVVITIA